MSHGFTCGKFIFAFALVTTSIASGQAPASTENITLYPGTTIALNPQGTWQGAQLIVDSKGKAFRKLFLVTADNPNRRQTCRVQSFTADELVCSRALGGSRTWHPQQIAALIVPGDDNERRWVLIGFNGGLGASIWATIVLAATCPACAAGTAFAALVCFAVAGAIAYTDDVPDRLLYLAPGKELSRKLGYVQE